MLSEKQPARVAVFVSGGGTNLQALLDASARGELPSCRISLVLSSSPTAFALQRAKQAGVPTEILMRRTFPSDEDFAAALDALLAHYGVDFIVLAGYLTILPACFTARHERRILNVHPSLIPAFCGAGYYGLRVHEAALQRGVKVSGATVHFVNEIPDGGEIILQKAVAVEPGDTPELLQRRIMEQAEWQLLPQATELVAKELLQIKANEEASR